jgi:hypothetical protein
LERGRQGVIEVNIHVAPGLLLFHVGHRAITSFHLQDERENDIISTLVMRKFFNGV